MTYFILFLLVALLASQVYLAYQRRFTEEPKLILALRFFFILSLSFWIILYLILGYAGGIGF